jgi:membrane associated rhomboid family serine protease
VGRKRRRERRERDAQVVSGAEAPKRVDKTDERRRAKYAADRKRLERRRTIIGMLALIPLAAWAVQLPFSPLGFIGLPPRDAWLLIWAALFGSFLGLTIRLILERRRFERAAANGRPA